MTDSSPGARSSLLLLRLSGRSPAWLPVGLAAAAPCLPLLPLVFRDQTLWFRDFSLYFVPMKALLVELWRGGHLPLWDPYVRSGLPFLANPQVGVFYPPSLLLVGFGVNPGLMLFTLLHLAAGGAGLYLFLREVRLGVASALVGAFGFGLGGYLASLVNVLNNLQSAAWIPWLLLFAARLQQRPSRGGWAGLTLAFALALLGGELQLAALGLGLAVALVLLPVLPTPLGGPAGPGRRLSATALVGLAAGSAVALTAFQLLPTAELLQESVRRSGFPIELASADAFKPAWVSSVAFPRPAMPGGDGSGSAAIHRMPWLLSAYAGIVVAWLAAVGACSGSRRWTVFWAAAGLTGMLLALGSHTALFRIAYDLLPLLRSVRYSEKFLLLPALALPALAAAGAEALAAGRVPRTGCLAGGAGVLLSAVASLVWMHEPSRPSPPVALAAALPIALGVVIVLVLVGRRTLSGRRGVALLGALTVVDLAPQAAAVNPGVSWRFYEKPWTAAVLDSRGEDPSSYRIRSTPLAADMEEVAIVRRARLFSNHYFFHQSLAPNLGQLYGYLEQDGMAGVETRSTAELIDALLELDVRAGLRLLRLESVRYVVTSFPLPAEDVVQVAAHDDLPIGVVRVRDALPRAYVAAEWEVVADSRVALRRALREDFGLGRDVVLDRPPGLSRTREPASSPGLLAPVEWGVVPAAGRVGLSKAANAGVTRAVWEPSAARFDLDLERPGVLVVTDAYYPGWRARLDRRTVPVLRANGYQRAVAVPAGRHRVELVYRPASFARGLAISAASVLLLGLGLIVTGLWSRRAKRTSRRPPRTAAGPRVVGTSSRRELAGVEP